MGNKKLLSGLVLFVLSVSLVVTLNIYPSLSNALPTNQASESILNKLFQDTEGAFVLKDLKDNQYIRYNKARCSQRFSPYSTFKIPNSLIALETGVIKDENIVTPYDSEKHPPERWWPREWQSDHSLRSAIKYSVVWFYQEIAKQVGKEKYQKYMEQFQYGNEDVSGPIDQFWLNNSLQISPNEQIDFLTRFYNNELSLSNRTTDIVKDILVLEKTDTYKLSGKTGLGSAANGKSVGWLVGYLEREDNVYFFATNLEDSSSEALMGKRKELTKQILAELGLLQ
ncbi:class D beta-lactamase [Lyngbya aestuarii]|uniref:class D beta-lactamase n=1 Tax=Lyngbya aestuarii TaxID=118322 RepID=UPI00403DD0D4